MTKRKIRRKSRRPSTTTKLWSSHSTPLDPSYEGIINPSFICEQCNRRRPENDLRPFSPNSAIVELVVCGRCYTGLRKGTLTPKVVDEILAKRASFISSLKYQPKLKGKLK